MAFVPGLLVSGTPLKFNSFSVLSTYWVGLAFQSIFLAWLLYVIQFPARETIKPLWFRYGQDKRRLVLLVPFLVDVTGDFCTRWNEREST